MALLCRETWICAARQAFSFLLELQRMASPNSKLLLRPWALCSFSLRGSAGGRPFRVFTLAFSMNRNVTTELCPSGADATRGVRLPGDDSEGLGLLRSGVQGAVTRPVLEQLLLPKGPVSNALRTKEPVLLYMPSWECRASGFRPLRSKWILPALRLGVRQRGGL